MPAHSTGKSSTYVLNHCTKYLARLSADPRHDYTGEYAGQRRASISECWRFPIVDSSDEPKDDAYEFNDVTFVWPADPGSPPARVELICTVDGLWSPQPLARVEGSRYWACTLVAHKGERHYYKFVVDGRPLLDEINPQRLTLDNGEEWSCFFTWACTQPISFERWELCILDRLCRHILPFNSREAENFLKRGANESNTSHLYRLDTSVGVSNFIDKIISREERHHLYTYKTCIELIDLVLRARNPFIEPANMDESMYKQLYDDLAVLTNRGDSRYASTAATLAAQGWDFARYDNPGYFLNVLRRHAATGAFSHPKYGGNAGGMGWAFLADRYRDAAGNTLFDWGRAIEYPLGRNREYRG